MFNPTLLRQMHPHLASLTNDELFDIYMARIRVNAHKRVYKAKQAVPPVVAQVEPTKPEMATGGPVQRKQVPPYQFAQHFFDIQ